MVDNFDLIKYFISNNSVSLDDDNDMFYRVQLIQRKKDNPTMKGDCLVFKRYYINKLSDLDEYKDEIIKLCQMFNLRAYFDVDVKSYKQTTLNSLVELSTRVANNDFKKPYALYDSCVGKYTNSSYKRWIIDVDVEDSDVLSVSELADFYTKTICKCKPGNSVMLQLKTKSGIHIITKPFDLKTFGEMISKANINKSIDDLVKKKATTILYIS